MTPLFIVVSLLFFYLFYCLVMKNREEYTYLDDECILHGQQRQQQQQNQYYYTISKTNGPTTNFTGGTPIHIPPLKDDVVRRTLQSGQSYIRRMDPNGHCPTILNHNQTVDQSDSRNKYSKLLVVQGINATPNNVAEQIYNLYTSPSPRMLPKLWMMKSRMYHHETIHVVTATTTTTRQQQNGTTTGTDGTTTGGNIQLPQQQLKNRRKHRRHNPPPVISTHCDHQNNPQPQLQHHSWVQIQGTFLPWLFSEQWYSIHYIYIPEQNLVLWNVTTDTSTSLYDDTIHVTTTSSNATGTIDTSRVNSYGSGFLYWTQNHQDSDDDPPPVVVSIRMVHSVNIAWYTIVPSFVADLIQLLLPPVLEWRIGLWLTRCVLTDTMPWIKEQSEHIPPDSTTTASVVSSSTCTNDVPQLTNHPDDVCALVSSPISTTSHTPQRPPPNQQRRILQFLRQHWWRMMDRPRHSRSNHNDDDDDENSTEHVRWHPDDELHGGTDHIRMNEEDVDTDTDRYTTTDVVVTMQKDGNNSTTTMDRSSRVDQNNVPPGVRPIGWTRYLLVCSILSLALYNIYLFFAQ
jgi:hypothetical protein